MKASFWKKVVCSFLVVSFMTISPARAQEQVPETTTVTIIRHEEAASHIYRIYQVFTGSQEKEDGALGEVRWGDGIDAFGFVQALKREGLIPDNIEPTNAVEAAAAIGAQEAGTEIARVAHEYLKGDGFLLDQGQTSIEVPEGYYLIVDITEGKTRNQSLLQVTSNLEINQKWEDPVLTLKVLENDKASDLPANGWNDVADSHMGETIPFVMSTKVPADLDHFEVYPLVFSASLPAGLHLQTENVAVYTTDPSGSPVPVSDFEADIASVQDGQRLQVTLPDVKKDKGFDAGDPVYVVYKPLLNEKARIGVEGNLSTATLQFPSNPYDPSLKAQGTTQEDKAVVFTYQLDVINKGGKDGNQQLLNVAYHLSKTEDNQTLYYRKEEDGTIRWVEKTARASVLKPDASTGKIHVPGLDDGDYTLIQLKAEDGYNLAKPISFTVAAETVHEPDWTGTNHDALKNLFLLDANGKRIDQSEDKKIVELIIRNQKGPLLPQTGISTRTLLYLAGVLLALAGLVVLRVYRRKAEK